MAMHAGLKARAPGDATGFITNKATYIETLDELTAAGVTINLTKQEFL